MQREECGEKRKSRRIKIIRKKESCLTLLALQKFHFSTFVGSFLIAGQVSDRLRYYSLHPRKSYRFPPRGWVCQTLRSAFRACCSVSFAASGRSRPQRKMSIAAKPCSGQVWMLRWDSAKSSTPVTPPSPPKVWKRLSSTVAPMWRAVCSNAVFR